MFLQFFLFFILASIDEAQSSVTKHILMESCSICPNNNQLPAKIKRLEVHNEKSLVIVSGLLELNEIVKGPLEFVSTFEKCNMELTKCTSFLPVTVPDFCPILELKVFGTKSFSRVIPKLKCPIKAVIFPSFLINFYFSYLRHTFVFNNSELDLTYVEKIIPSNVGRYNAKFTIFQTSNPSKKRLILCFKTKSKIILSSIRARGAKK